MSIQLLIKVDNGWDGGLGSVSFPNKVVFPVLLVNSNFPFGNLYSLVSKIPGHILKNDIPWRHGLRLT